MTTRKEHKRTRNVLSIEDKLKIITRLETGETGASLARIYNVGRATIFDIKKRKDEILSYAAKFDSEDGSKKRKTMKKANDERLEEAVYQWIQDMRRDGEHITGPIVCKKALELNLLLQGSTEFKASSGWLNNFKSRRGIKDFEVPEPAVSVVPPEEVFKESFLKMIKDEGFLDDDVYIVNETNLHWKSLPCTSLESQNVTLNTNLEMNIEYITIMLCANTNSEHVLSLLVIGKSENPTLFEDKKYLLMRYKEQKDDCTQSDIFLEWFSQEFIPSVKIKRQENRKTGKVLLVIGNSPSYPPLDKLNSIDDSFIVRFIPPYVLPLFHPIDKDILLNLKRLYKKQTLHYILQQNSDSDHVIDFLQNFTITDCCSMLMDAWGILTQNSTIINTDDDMEEILFLLQQIPKFSDYPQDDVNAWLNDDYGNQILTEEEPDTTVQVTCPDMMTDVLNKEDNANMPTNEEALNAIETVLAWCKEQSECSSKDLSVLKKLKNLAAKKLNQS